jgi:hypothetical protein
MTFNVILFTLEVVEILLELLLERGAQSWCTLASTTAGILGVFGVMGTVGLSTA